MMNKPSLLAACLLCLAAAAQAEVHASQAWARFTVPGMQSGGVFVRLENGRPADALIGGSTPVAERVEIHEHIMQGGQMRMQAMPHGLPLPERSRTELKPGGHHIMLIGLKQPLAAGSRFPLTLKFRHAPAQTVQVEVKSPAEEAGGMQHRHHHAH